jgi:hypothetical protein
MSLFCSFISCKSMLSELMVLLYFCSTICKFIWHQTAKKWCPISISRFTKSTLSVIKLTEVRIVKSWKGTRTNTTKNILFITNCCKSPNTFNQRDILQTQGIYSRHILDASCAFNSFRTTSWLPFHFGISYGAEPISYVY